MVLPLEQVVVNYLTQRHFDRSNHTGEWITPLIGKLFYKSVDNSGTHRKCTVIFLILYQTVSRDPREANFFCCCNRRPLRLTRKFLLSSDLFDEKTKTYLMRILQRKAWLQTLITSYWDHNTLRAQLCFSYAPSSQPTFDSHCQDFSLSLCVLIKELDSLWVLSVYPQARRGCEAALGLFETPASQFAGAWGQQGMEMCAAGLKKTFRERIKLICWNHQDVLVSNSDLSCFLFFVSHTWPFSVQFIWY